MLKKVLLYSALAMVLLAIIAVYVWDLFQLDTRLEQVVANKVEAVFGDACNVGEILIRPGSVRLKNVKFAFDSSPYRLEIDEVRLGFSLGSLLNGSSDLQKSAEEITLEHPQLILHYTPYKSAKPDVNLSLELTEKAENVYRSIIKEYDFIKRITIANGKVVVQNDETGEETQLAHGIDGWAYTDDQERAWLRMAGHFFESKDYNMVIYGQLDSQRGGLDIINVDLHDYKIGKEIPFLIPNYFEVLDGVVNGHLEVTERRTPTQGFDIEGTINLSHGQAKLQTENIFVENINIEARLKGWNLEIKNSSQLLNGSPVSLQGQIRNILAPELDLFLVSNEVDIKQFTDRFLPEKPLPFRGIAAVEAHIYDSISQPKVEGQVITDSLWFFNTRINHLSSSVTLDNLVLRFEDIETAIEDADISGEGRIDFRTPEKLLDFKLHASGDLTPYVRRYGLNLARSCKAESRISVLGPVKFPASSGDLLIQIEKDAAESLLMEGSFLYHEGVITMNGAAVEGGVRIHAVAYDLFDTRKLDIQADNLEELFVFAENPALDFVRRHYNLNVMAERIGERPRFKVDGYRKDNYEKLFTISSDSAASGSGSLSGSLSLFPNSPEFVRGDFELTLQDEFIRLQSIYIGDWLNGSLELSRSDYSLTSGKLDISNLRLATLLRLLGSSQHKFDGDLFGQIAVVPSASQPTIAGNLWLFNGFFRDIGPLRGELGFAVDQSMLDLQKLILENDGVSKVQANGQLDFKSGEVDAHLSAVQIDVNHVIKIITGADRIVQGTGTAGVTLKGPLERLPIYGSVQVSDAKILRFEFDEVNWNFGDVTRPNGSYLAKDRLYIGEAGFTKSGQFQLRGSGSIPFRSRDELDVHLSGAGNFLSMLTDIDDVFADTRSSGQLDLHMSGFYTKPKFAGSSLEFDNGMLRLTKAIDKVENLMGKFAIRSDADYFLDIKQLTATIGGQPISISNIDTIPEFGITNPEALRVAGDDLNLGALIIETSSQGIPVYVPGLMEGGEVGFFALVGRPGEPFYAAGPWAHPYVRGEIHVSDANVTFPFLESGTSDSTIVYKILNNINWDVRALSRQDTRFVKQFTTGVYVNFEIDRESSHLEFSGVMKDSTFGINGELISTRGDLEYLDLAFRVEQFDADFNRSSFYPMVSGKAWTAVRDTANVPYDIYLELFTMDDITNQEVNKGRWDRLNIKLTSEHPRYNETEADVMATLGYSSETVDEQATKVVGYSTDQLLFRPIMRPVERGLERAFGLDVVRFSYAITQNFLHANFNDEQVRSSLELLRSSRLFLGKYLTEDLFLVYSGELKAGIDYQFLDKGVGLQHSLGLEYRLNKQWLLQMEYDYNTLLETHKDDKKIWLRHSFPF